MSSVGRSINEYYASHVGHWVECPCCGRRGQKRIVREGSEEKRWVVHEMGQEGWIGCVFESEQTTPIPCPTCGEPGSLTEVTRRDGVSAGRVHELWIIHERHGSCFRGCLQTNSVRMRNDEVLADVRPPNNSTWRASDFGQRYGDGFGSGVGHGFGSGFGYGYGYGYGFGAGYGDGSGDGSGVGHGAGYGAGSGVGAGHSQRRHLGTIDGYDVELFEPWRIVRVGCEIHSVRHWRAHWQTIAARHGVNVEEVEGAVEELLRR